MLAQRKSRRTPPAVRTKRPHPSPFGGSPPRSHEPGPSELAQSRAAIQGGSKLPHSATLPPRMRKPVFFALLLLSLPALAIDINDTRLLSDPAISPRQIAFGYANDLWVANPDGGGVRRLTSHPGVESGPRFSPDGSLIAFPGRYEGNTDVYVVPATGGVPKRLTYHPYNDIALGFTPDGKSILFSSPREVHTRD